MSDELLEFCRKLGYEFKDPNLLIEALTLPTGRVRDKNCKRLGFVGNRIVSFLVSEMIYIDRPTLPTKRMHCHFSTLVSNKHFFSLIRSIGLQNFVINDNQAKPNLALVFKALIAAVYFDSNQSYDDVKKVFLPIFNNYEQGIRPQVPIPKLKPERSVKPRILSKQKILRTSEKSTVTEIISAQMTCKTRLTKLIKSKFGFEPEFCPTKQASMMDKNKRHLVEVKINGIVLGYSVGKSIGEASEKASALILMKTMDLTQKIPEKLCSLMQAQTHSL